jgi:hypothetical protein
LHHRGEQELVLAGLIEHARLLSTNKTWLYNQSHPVLPLASGLLQIGCRMWSGGCSSLAGPQVTSVRSLPICHGVSLAETGTGAV